MRTRVPFWMRSRAALEARIAAFTGSFGLTRGYMNYGGRAFYEERMPGSDNFDLVVSDEAGKRKLVDVAMAVSINDVQPEQALWLAPVSQVNDPNVKWTPFVARGDEVTAVAAAGGTLFLLSHKNAPTFQVLSVKAGRPLAAARVLVPAEKDRVLDAIHTASDALYVLARQGGYSRLLRVQPIRASRASRSTCRALSSRPRPLPTIRRRRTSPVLSSA